MTVCLQSPGNLPFLAHSQNCEKRLLASSCLSVRPSVRMEQLGCHRTDIQNILFFEHFSKIFLENSSFIKI